VIFRAKAKGSSRPLPTRCQGWLLAAQAPPCTHPTVRRASDDQGSAIHTVLQVRIFMHDCWHSERPDLPVRHEVAVRREALEIEGGARPPRQAVAAAWWELSAA
jgi:hypothetical protein